MFPLSKVKQSVIYSTSYAVLVVSTKGA